MFRMFSLHTTRASPDKDDDRHNNEEEKSAHKGSLIAKRLLTRGDLHFNFIFVVRMHDIPLLAMR